MTARPSIAAEAGTQTDTAFGLVTFVEGGLGAVAGLRSAGVSAGFRHNPERRDLALVVCDTPAVAAGVFTRNSFCAAPGAVSREHLKRARLSSEHEQQVAVGQHLDA
ncbi:MAG: bifunctional ornithine acetyltransferase/N-acetylglutamate synthase, partial [Coriobacteriales bacterium]|nr:bifunctional ornithine acetyltransferase/N-acetylglutamate synthase [Coriobacteriales bacterium]